MAKVTMTKRFYVASNLMTDGTADRKGWMRLHGEAIEEAKQRLIKEPHTEKCYVVEVVTVIRRPQPQVIIEHVRKEK